MQCFENVGNKNGLKPDIWASIQFSGDNVWSMPLIKHHPWAKLFNCRTLQKAYKSALLKKQRKKSQKLLFTLHSQQQPLLSIRPFSFLSILTFFPLVLFNFFLTFSQEFSQGIRLNVGILIFVEERKCFLFAGSFISDDFLYSPGTRTEKTHPFWEV